MRRAYSMCSEPGCDKRARRKGLLCDAHFKERWAGQTPPPLEKRQRNKGETCSCSGCYGPAYARGLCQSHTERYYCARSDGTLELGHWKEPISRLKRGCSLVRSWCPDDKLAGLSRYAERRGIELGDAVLELALQHLVWRSGREREEISQDVWRRSDAMEAV